jgi:hypothetical protein
MVVGPSIDDLGIARWRRGVVMEFKESHEKELNE